MKKNMDSVIHIACCGLKLQENYIFHPKFELCDSSIQRMINGYF